MIRPRSYIIPFRSPYKTYWDYFIMAAAIYNSLWTPLTVSFDYAQKVEQENFTIKLLDQFILFVFVADIGVQFATTFLIIATGDEVFKPSHIAKNYMLSLDFIIDFLSTVPFGFFTDFS